MCTAVTYKTKDFYFGRTLDYDFSFGEEIVVTPRNYEFNFRYMGSVDEHYAMIGMAHVDSNYPLYYDAVNEKGVCMAGLNFVGNAVYRDVAESCSDNGTYLENVAQFEFIPWVLAKCASVSEARELLSRINLVGTPFSPKLPSAQLHWIVADSNEAVTVESVESGLKIYDNPVGVLTNNPPFDMQLFQLNNYMRLSPGEPENHFSPKLSLEAYSRGMGAIGLPGDLSSASRFVRAVFTKMNSVSGTSEEESVNQFFHILGAVSQQRGCCETPDGKYEITIYTSCCNADKGIYYYTSYDNHRITAVDMHQENLDDNVLKRYKPVRGEQICRQNQPAKN